MGSKNPVLFFYGCITVCYKLSSLKRHTFIPSQLPWARSWGTAYLLVGSIQLLMSCWTGDLDSLSAIS